MADTIKTNLGPVTAYADAKAHGYTGTREEFGQLLANAELNLKAAETAKEGAEAAKQAAETAQQAAAENQKNTETQAANAKASADTAAEQAAVAEESAADAANSATAAQESETNAGLSATAAANAEAAAKQAQNAAETAKADAETAKTVAGNSADAAANSAADAKKTLESIPADYSTLSGKVDENANGISELKEDLAKLSFIDKSVNVFDNTSEEIVLNKYLNWKGAEADEANTFISHYIEVESGDILRWIYNPNTSTNYGSFYDSNKAFTAQIASSNPTKSSHTIDGFGLSCCEVVVPNNVKYARINLAKSHISNGLIMVTVNDDMPTIYVPYKNELVIKAEKVTDFARTNPLFGKSVYSHGDSIMYGTGDGGKGMLQYITDDYGMNYTKYAVSGATIAYSDSYNSPKVISRDIVNMSDTAPDYVIIEGGYNDSCHPSAIPLGSITDGYDSELDDATFCGALESYLKQIKTKYPSAKIGFVISHKAGVYGGNRWNTKSNGYIPYVRAICEKWSVPYLDMYKDGGFVPSPSNLTVSYTDDSDYVHPTEDGYKLFYYHKLLKFMESL